MATWFSVSGGVIILLSTLICFFFDCKYCFCSRHDNERGIMAFEMTPKRRNDRSDNRQATPCQCGYENGGMHTQVRVGRRNNSCPV